MKKIIAQIASLLIALAAVPVHAQDDVHGEHADPHAGHDMSHGDDPMPMEAEDPHAGHDMSHDMEEQAVPAAEMDHSGHGSAVSATAPADARDPHAYSDGYDFGPLPHPQHADEHSFYSVMVDRLESVNAEDNSFTAYDINAWYGRDFDRVVLTAEGHIDGGEVEEASTELLWSHAVAAFWNARAGVRYDSGEGPDRAWLALGVEGLSPYWVETDATLYVGESGRTAVSVEAEYDVLITQRLALQPRVEAEIYGKDDPELSIGSGLSEATVGLRLRYELLREFAPYVGIEWAGSFGGTADYLRDAGRDTEETRAVAGVRFWF